MENKSFSIKVEVDCTSPLNLTPSEITELKNFLVSPKDNYESFKKLLDTEPFKSKVLNDIFLNSIIQYQGLPLKVGELKDLTVSYLDYGWDCNYDYLDNSIRELSENFDDVDWNRLRTFRLFDYYNKFANKMTEELEGIFGYAQEVYLGFDEQFIIGFDVEGGSVITVMPITFMGSSFKLREYDKKSSFFYKEDQYEKMYFNKGNTFYGSGSDHFYNTEFIQSCNTRIPMQSCSLLPNIHLRLD